ncbi:hypothetical protein Tco_1406690 [Tanacetum coccineum]
MIWGNQKRKLLDNSLSKTQRVWKDTGKNYLQTIGYQWSPQEETSLRKNLIVVLNGDPQGKKFALGEMCHLTKLSVKWHTFIILFLKWLQKEYMLVRDLNGTVSVQGPVPVIMTPGQLKSGLAPTSKSWNCYLTDVVPPLVHLCSTTMLHDAPVQQVPHRLHSIVIFQSNTNEIQRHIQSFIDVPHPLNNLVTGDPSFGTIIHRGISTVKFAKGISSREGIDDEESFAPVFTDLEAIEYSLPHAAIKRTPCQLQAYADVDHAGCKIQEESKSGGAQFLEFLMIPVNRRYGFDSIKNSSLYSEYEYGIRYHSDKANVVTDALSRKERVKPRRVRAMAMTIQYRVRGMILVSLVGSVMDVAYASRYLVHPRPDKKYYNLHDMYWWPRMKRDIAIYVIHFGKKGKLAPRYVGPFEILERIGLIAYRLRLPEELSSVYDTFHVSNLKKCLADANLHVPLDEIEDCWNSNLSLEFTWEREDYMKSKYPQLFVDRADESAS